MLSLRFLICSALLGLSAATWWGWPSDVRTIRRRFGSLRYSRLFLSNPCLASPFHRHEVFNLGTTGVEREYWFWSGHVLAQISALEEFMVPIISIISY